MTEILTIKTYGIKVVYIFKGGREERADENL
jgi:hypothetical protein